MTEGNRAEDPENVRQKDGRSIIRQAVLALLLCGVAALVACAPVKEPERKEKTVLQLWHYWDREESRQCLAKLVQKFNDTHQDVEIQINYIADEDFKKFEGRYFSTPKKMGAQTAEANINAGIAAAKQINAFFKDGCTKFKVNK
jgi:ABC-type glycerol-3-phosphate transport system substrate-binding protein